LVNTKSRDCGGQDRQTPMSAAAGAGRINRTDEGNSH
jgi:hypothetical protein